MKFNTLFGLHFKYLTIDLLVALSGVQIGAPYSIIGLIRESKSVVSALNDSFERITVLFRPKNALMAFVFIVDCAVLSSPESCNTIPK